MPSIVVLFVSIAFSNDSFFLVSSSLALVRLFTLEVYVSTLLFTSSSIAVAVAEFALIAAMVAAHREAEEEKRRESERICAAIEQQMRQVKNQKVIEVKMKRKKRRIKTAAEMLAEVDMEDEE